MNHQIAVNEIDIETEIELPPSGTKPRLYPALYTMEVGQSFTRPVEQYTTLHSASQACRKTTNRRFAMRKTGDIVRIWRIE